MSSFHEKVNVIKTANVNYIVCLKGMVAWMQIVVDVSRYCSVGAKCFFVEVW